MPNEPALRPLTPRAECTIDGVDYSNLFETDGKMSVTQDREAIVVTTTGQLRSVAGAASEVGYRLTHRFFGNRVQKEWVFTSAHAQVICVVEPFVKNFGLTIGQTAPQRVALRAGGHEPWTFAVTRSPAGCTVSCGEDAEEYWSPFPAVNGYPVVVTLTTTPGQPTAVETVLAPAATGPAK